MKKFLLTAGTLILLASLAGLLFMNFNFGVVMVWGVAAVLIAYGLFFDRLIRLKWLTGGILAGCAAAAAMMLFVGVYGKSDNADFKEDAVIVLGAAVRGDTVSRVLADRLDKAAEYHSANPGAVIVVSGGMGPQESVTEAAAMEKYLLARGVPGEKIVKEEAASSTYENLLFSKAILDGMFDRPYKVVVITNDFHIYRAAAYAKKRGFDATHLHAKTDWYSLPMNYLRECAAIFKMWLWTPASE